MKNTDEDERAVLRRIVTKSVVKIGSIICRFFSSDSCYWYLQCSVSRFDYQRVSMYILRAVSSRILTTIEFHIHNVDGSLVICHLNSCLILVITEEIVSNQVLRKCFLILIP
jgi:hypothetical protein